MTAPQKPGLRSATRNVLTRFSTAIWGTGVLVRQEQTAGRGVAQSNARAVRRCCRTPSWLRPAASAEDRRQPSSPMRWRSTGFFGLLVLGALARPRADGAGSATAPKPNATRRDDLRYAARASRAERPPRPVLGPGGVEDESRLELPVHDFHLLGAAPRLHGLAAGLDALEHLDVVQVRAAPRAGHVGEAVQALAATRSAVCTRAPGPSQW